MQAKATFSTKLCTKPKTMLNIEKKVLVYFLTPGRLDGREVEKDRSPPPWEQKTHQKLFYTND